MDMRRIIAITTATGILAAVAATAIAETSVNLDLASAYVFRGYTLNDEAVFQPGIEASGLGLPEEIGLFTVGAWGNYNIGDYGGKINDNEFSEIDWYASYTAPIDLLDLYIGVIDYTFPGLDSTEDVELYIGAAYDLGGFGLLANVYRGVSGSALGGVATVELGAEFGLDFTEQFSGLVAADVRYVDGSKSGYGWNDGTISAALDFALSENWSVYGSLTYIAQLDDTVLRDERSVGNEIIRNGYDVEVLGMVGVGSTF
jgi:uncharacterized protein (TIGR02001 family)